VNNQKQQKPEFSSSTLSKRWYYSSRHLKKEAILLWNEQIYVWSR